VNVEAEVLPTGATTQIVNLRAGFLRLTTVLAGRTEPLSGVAYVVYTDRDIEGNRKRITGSSHQKEVAARFLLPAGRYFVTASHSDRNTGAETAIEAGRTRDVQLRLPPLSKQRPGPS
jgi:hypothetical protein